MVGVVGDDGAFTVCCAGRGEGMSHLIGIGLAFIFIVVSVLALFLLSRELICWCWKINERIALLAEIRDLLRDRKGQEP